MVHRCCEQNSTSKILQYPNVGLKLTNIRGWLWIFSCALQYKVTGKCQRSKVLNFRVSYQEKCVCSTR